LNIFAHREDQGVRLRAGDGVTELIPRHDGRTRDVPHDAFAGVSEVDRLFAVHLENGGAICEVRALVRSGRIEVPHFLDFQVIQADEDRAQRLGVGDATPLPPLSIQKMWGD
jgi:hypothetical protein